MQDGTERTQHPAGIVSPICPVRNKTDGLHPGGMILLFPTAGGSKKNCRCTLRKGRGGAAGVRRENCCTPADQKPGADPVPPHGGMRPEQKQAQPDNKTFHTNFCLAGRFFPESGCCFFFLERKTAATRIPAPVVYQKAGGIISSPAVSANPNIRFMFCTACPEAPFTILSSTDTICSIRPL